MISIRHGFSFAMPIIIAAFVVTFLGIISFFESPIFGIGLIIASIFVWSSSYGIQINPTDKNYREFGSVFGLKTGEWKPFDSLPFLTVLRNREGMTVYSKSNRSTTSIDDSFCVYLLNASHRKKVLVQKFDTKELAIKNASELASRLKKELVEFDPVRI
jgi:hypothetical protein